MTQQTHKEESQERIVQRIKELAVLLGGETQLLTTANSQGVHSSKIVIEYNRTTGNT